VRRPAGPGGRPAGPGRRPAGPVRKPSGPLRKEADRAAQSRGDRLGGEPRPRPGPQRETVLPAGRGRPRPAAAEPSRRDVPGHTQGAAKRRQRLRARRRRSLNRGDPGRRLRAGLLCIGFVLSLFAGRLVQLQGMDGSRYRALAYQQRLQTVQLPAVRGSITAADGTVLAATVQTDLVFADPKLMNAAQEPQIAAGLAGPLGMSQAQILGLLQHPSSPEYVVLKKSVSAITAAQIKNMRLPGSGSTGLPGIAMTPSYTREYPNGQLAANLIGFTDTDSAGNLVGEAGIEQQDNSLLTGRDGSQEEQTTSSGQLIPLGQETLKPTEPGRDVRLTILPSLQYSAEQACKQRVTLTHAAYCTVVIMQPHTGQILAMAQYPTFSPSDVTSLAATADMPVAYSWQPGSTAKVITVAAALEHGGQTLMSPYTVPYQIDVHGFHFHDAESHPTERLTVAGILANSSNVGMVQVVQHVSPQVQYHYLRAFGLGEPTGLSLPGETAGILPAPGSKNYWGDTRYTLAFGQGVTANAVQMASVYATIANGGVRVRPSIVAGTTNAKGQFVPAPPAPRRRVIQARTARELISVLEQVPMVDAQAGVYWGDIAGYQIAAKTGTAQELNNRGCLCNYGASYIGMTPPSNPQLVVAVNVQDPKGSAYYGDQVAGPVFYQVMRSALQTLKIPPNYAKRPGVRLTAP